MILYCDTSALVKRYVEEEGTAEVDALWDKAIEVATSTVAYAEGKAAFRRKTREGVLSRRGYTRAVAVFNEEHLSFVLVQIGPQLNMIVQRLVEKYPLRGFDAIHLASALIVKEGWVDVVFACFDKGLNRAAKREGLKVVFKDPVKGKEKSY